MASSFRYVNITSVNVSDYYDSEAAKNQMRISDAFVGLFIALAAFAIILDVQGAVNVPVFLNSR